MSHRITTKTEFKDRNLVLAALKKCNLEHTDLGGDKFQIKAGRSNGTLNLKTGSIEGTYETMREEDYAPLAQAYGVAKARMECLKQGISVESEKVDVKTGFIILTCQTNG